MVKASLRFAKPLPITNTLIACAQYHKLLSVEWYCKEAFDYNARCSASSSRRDRRAARTLVGVYIIDEWWSLSTKFPVTYLINMACSEAGEHWVSAFLEDSRQSEYFNSYGTTQLESIYQSLQEMDHKDVHASTKMTQGHSQRPWKIFTFCLLVMHCLRLPLGVVTSVFRECDNVCNEAMNRNVLR